MSDEMRLNLHLQGRLDVVLEAGDSNLNNTLNRSGSKLDESSASIFSVTGGNSSHGASLVREVLKNQQPKETVNAYGNVEAGGSSSSSSSSRDAKSQNPVHASSPGGKFTPRDAGIHDPGGAGGRPRRSPRESGRGGDGFDPAVLKKADQERARKKATEESGGTNGVQDTPRRRNGRIGFNFVQSAMARQHFLRENHQSLHSKFLTIAKRS